jgi:hypothetical protein
MKYTRILLALLAVAVLVGSANANPNPLIVNLTSAPVSTGITFTGSGPCPGANCGASFTFNGGGSSFQLQGANSYWVPVLPNGLYGTVAGTFRYVNPVVVPGVIDYATLTSSPGSEFIIHDGTGHDFTAALNLGIIQSAGLSGSANYGLSGNLSNFQYTGSNAALVQLRNAIVGSGALRIDWTFASPGVSLVGLETGTHTVGYDGTLNALTPEPGFYGALAIGLVGLVALSKRTFKRSART